MHNNRGRNGSVVQHNISNPRVPGLAGRGKENRGKKAAQIPGAEWRKTLKNLLLWNSIWRSRIMWHHLTDRMASGKWLCLPMRDMREGKLAGETPPKCRAQRSLLWCTRIQNWHQRGDIVAPSHLQEWHKKWVLPFGGGQVGLPWRQRLRELYWIGCGPKRDLPREKMHNKQWIAESTKIFICSESFINWREKKKHWPLSSIKCAQRSSATILKK